MHCSWCSALYVHGCHIAVAHSANAKASGAAISRIHHPRCYFSLSKPDFLDKNGGATWKQRAPLSNDTTFGAMSTEVDEKIEYFSERVTYPVNDGTSVSTTQHVHVISTKCYNRKRSYLLVESSYSHGSVQSLGEQGVHGRPASHGKKHSTTTATTTAAAGKNKNHDMTMPYTKTGYYR